MSHVWRCPSCLHDHDPDDNYDAYFCFDCEDKNDEDANKCTRIERCFGCDEDEDECTCNPECANCCAPLIVPEGETAYHRALCVDCAP